MIQNFELHMQSNLSLQSTNLSSPIQYVFIELIKDAKAIESDKFKLFTDKQKKQLSPRVYTFFANLNVLSQQSTLFDSAFAKDPYLQVLFNESRNPIHPNFWGGQIPYLTMMNYCFDVFNRLGEAIRKNKCALEFASWKQELAIKTNQQKTNAGNLLKKHKQMKCEYIELPCVPDNTLCVNRIPEQMEASYPTTLKSFLKICHRAEELQGKLCDVHWRFVKGLDGIPTAHILMYLIGDDINYAPLLSANWNKVCIEKGLCTSSSQIQIRSIHCYQGNGLTSKYWKSLIDSCQAPLEFYRYQANGLSHVWKSYTGNI